MFCNKTNVNILTAHLLAAGIEDAVVCPGSRNAVIVHNLNECAQTASTTGHTMRLHPVTDERSAAFVAIGLWLATHRPIVVCVTSGSALLNLLPGVAEAAYRHIPLVIVSADRPARWIGQLDGQTLPQPDALLPYAPCWDIAEGDDEMLMDHACREALGATAKNGGQPVHINVPLEEPLFNFTTQALPEVEVCPKPEEVSPKPEEVCPEPIPADCLRSILEARHPAVIVGQYEEGRIEALTTLQRHGWTIFAENISNQGVYNDTFEDVDLLVHIGGALVEKRLKLQLREKPDLTVVRIDETDEIPATFGFVDFKVKAHPAVALQQIAEHLDAAESPLTGVSSAPFQEAEGIRHIPAISALFVGNSTAVRWTNKNFRVDVPTYCNRGVNGIEGSLSVAAGYSLVSGGKTLCVIGDLSFFYDCNALWNQRLDGRLRILLVNNRRGGIFYRLPGLDASPALDDYIAAQHANEARGIAESYRCTYLHAVSTDLVSDIDSLVERLLHTPSERPVILEISIEHPHNHEKLDNN